MRGAEVVPVELGQATLRRSLRDGKAASQLRVPVERPPGAEVDLAVDDGDNAPLDLKEVTAVLAPQPWIYLEPAQAGLLTARYGTAALTAPRYDLEAARAGIAKLRPQVASWGPPVRPSPTEPPPESPPPMSLVGATLPTASFTVTRAILPGPAARGGLAAISLDVAVLAHSATFADLRIREPGGHQVPYMLERLDEPVLVDVPVARLDADIPGGPHLAPRSSLYRVDLPLAHLPEGRLVVATDARVFSRQVTLLASRPPNASPRDPEVRTLGTHTWAHADAETPAPALAMSLEPQEQTAIYLRVDEGDNAPLALGKAHVELPGRRLRFFRPGPGELSLFYGDPALPPPVYDLALLAPSLAGAVADELPLGPETSANTGAGGAPATGMRVFWGVLVGAVVVLFAMIALLLRREDGHA